MNRSANYRENKKSLQTNEVSNTKGENSFLDNRPERTTQMKLQMLTRTQAPSSYPGQDVAQLKSNSNSVGLVGTKMNNRVAEIAQLTETRYEAAVLNNSAPAQLVSIQSLGDFNMSLADIVASMSTRAQGATLSMLADFEEVHAGCTYYVAWNEQEGDAARYGLMSLKEVPPPAQDDQPDDGVIAGSLWVEGLVADAGGGLGGQLLTQAEAVAQQIGKGAVSLAAYEYDMDDDGGVAIQNPYSVAGYYEHKGYRFSGEGYVEVDGDRQYYYPIYVKDIVD
jgi:hypothetical protein